MRRLAHFTALIVLAGCDGQVILPDPVRLPDGTIIEPPPVRATGGGSGSSGGSGPIVITGGGSGSGGGSVDLGPDQPVVTSRMSRLSHAEYENTVQDFLGLAAPSQVTKTFVGDATSGTFDNVGGELLVNSDLWNDYQRAAESLAQQATASAATMNALAGGTLPADDLTAIRAIGRRAFRRPLTNAEATALKTVWDVGPSVYPTIAARTASIRVTVEALLQSPNFLYRPELSAMQIAGVIPLTGYELASKLSYALWRTMPDEALLTAAPSLVMPDVYAAQVERLLADDRRIKAAIAKFHLHLLDTPKYRDITRAPNLFPDYSPAVAQALESEALRLVEEVVFEEKAGFARLMTANYTYVDQNLAKIYGLTGTFSGLTKVTFTDEKRSGLLTQLGFLAANSSSTDPDAIHRGVFINHRILCAPLPPPPMMVPALPPTDPSVPKTMRQRIDEHTGPGTCGAGCHGVFINPIGFAYENYDAIGKWRDTDKGLPVDATGAYAFAGAAAKVSYDGAAQLAKAISEQAMAHDCYAEHLLEFLHGRRTEKADRPLITRVGRLSLGDKAPVKQLLKALVTTPAFQTRGVAQ